MNVEDIKTTLFAILILGLLIFGGYWAFSNMESGSAHLYIQKIKILEEENNKLKEEVLALRGEISNLVSTEEPVVIKEGEVEVITEEEKPVEDNKNINLKYQTMINELQKLVSDNIYMKKGSQGTRVGTIQKFLNIYNNTSNRVDNDYGASTETAIKNFQKAEGLISDGEAGVNTFKKMISWLEKQG